MLKSSEMVTQELTSLKEHAKDLRDNCMNNSAFKINYTDFLILLVNTIHNCDQAIGQIKHLENLKDPLSDLLSDL